MKNQTPAELLQIFEYNADSSAEEVERFMDKKLQVPEKIKKDLVVPVAKSGPQVQALVDSGNRAQLIDANVKRMKPLLNALREYDSKD